VAYSDKQRKAYWAYRNALTKVEKEIINYYEIEWHLRHRVPTIEQVTTQVKKKFPQVTQISINYYLSKERRNVAKALEKRGIPWQQHSQEELTASQVAAAVTVMNFVDKRPVAEKLDQLGINETQYYAWLNDPQFKTMVDNLADQNLANIRPTAIAEFTKKINSGDWNAIKFWLETTGELGGTSNTQIEDKITMFIEIVQRHVKDPEVMAAIAADIIAVSGNRKIAAQNPYAIEGEVIPQEVLAEDPELMRAQRMVGF
jgi:glutathione peroxidase-family protein